MYSPLVQSRNAFLFRGGNVKSLWILLLAGTLMLAGCGGNSSSGSQGNGALAGNWQFTVASPSDQSFIGGVQGGFLLQNNSAVNGQVVYSVAFPPAQAGGIATVCNSGSAPISGTINGKGVTLTVTTGTQNFSFTGTLSADGTTMTGTYSSTAGSMVNGTPCGTVQSGLQWSAVSVPPLTGAIAGSFHSTGGAAGLFNQDFVVTGSLAQGPNIGASNATITGNLNFTNPSTSISNYPCFGSALVNGQISGNTVILQIIGTNGAAVGQIGGVLGSGLNSVTFNSTPNGYVLQSAAAPAYAVNTKSCGGSSINNPGDSGSLCLAVGNSTACQQPITLTPALLTFPMQLIGGSSTTPPTPPSPPQLLGSAPTSQTITLSNTDLAGNTLNGLTLNLAASTGAFYNNGPSDFDDLPNFTEQDTCASSPGSTFSLAPGKSCVITITFAPQESCPWLPFTTPGSSSPMQGAPPADCPIPLTATLTVNSPASADTNTAFAVPISGFGASAIEPSVPEIDFGAEALSESSSPHSLTFTNFSANPIQILDFAPCLNPPPKTPGGNSPHLTLPHPLQDTSPVGGLQVVGNGPGSATNITADVDTITYNCDEDPTSLLPNFQISSETCMGLLLAPQASCSLQVTYVPQPYTTANFANNGLDFFLQLNTLQCNSTDGVASDCEIDSGRFPVELKANPASPLRMTPSAGLDFGTVVISLGIPAAPQTITLTNDGTVASPLSVFFIGKVVVKGNYTETDNCPFSLAPGASCVLTLAFNPTAAGFDTGSITINYTQGTSESSAVLGNAQTIYLRGTGQ
jgi:hypothetical protein